jgi:hypothetical protein
MILSVTCWYRSDLAADGLVVLRDVDFFTGYSSVKKGVSHAPLAGRRIRPSGEKKSLVQMNPDMLQITLQGCNVKCNIRQKPLALFRPYCSGHHHPYCSYNCDL